MLDKKKTLEFLEYIKKPMTKETIEIIYNVENIKYEKCELYSDFIQSLFMLIFETYLGDDITSIKDQKNHFKWCWDKNVENFKKENIHIENIKLYNYLFDFIFDVFYYSTNKNENDKSQDNILKLWRYLFDFNANKSKADIDTMIEVYKLFENSLKKI